MPPVLLQEWVDLARWLRRFLERVRDERVPVGEIILKRLLHTLGAIEIDRQKRTGTPAMGNCERLKKPLLSSISEA